MPVNQVSFYDVFRSANWLYNGQRTGMQDDTTTERGAYWFLEPTNPPARDAGAAFFLPSEGEWYAAAYSDPGSADGNDSRGSASEMDAKQVEVGALRTDSDQVAGVEVPLSGRVPANLNAHTRFIGARRAKPEWAVPGESCACVQWQRNGYRSYRRSISKRGPGQPHPEARGRTERRRAS
jgi:hypothetical protein